MLLNASETPSNRSERVGLMFRARRVTALAGIVVAVCVVSASSAFAQSICNAGSQTVTTWVDITASCTITGSLTITTGVVKVNFSAAPTAVLRVQGDISISGRGVLWVEGGTFEIQQAFNRHRKLSSTDDAIVILKNTTVVVNQGDGLRYLVHFASGRSKMFVVNSTLDRTRNWLLSDQKGQSMLVSIGSRTFRPKSTSRRIRRSASLTRVRNPVCGWISQMAPRAPSISRFSLTPMASCSRIPGASGVIEPACPEWDGSSRLPMPRSVWGWNAIPEHSSPSTAGESRQRGGQDCGRREQRSPDSLGARDWFAEQDGGEQSYASQCGARSHRVAGLCVRERDAHDLFVDPERSRRLQ